MQGIPEFQPPPTEAQFNYDSRKGFRKKKGESPFNIEVDIKIKKEKRQSKYSNPDPWARLIGRANTAPIYLDGHLTLSLLDTGAQLSLIGREFCEKHNLPIQPLRTLIGCDSVNGTEVKYEGYVELNLQVPGREFNEDHLFLVVPPLDYHQQVPVIVGTYILDRLVEHINGLSQKDLESLDISWRGMHQTRLEAQRLSAEHGNEAPLGLIRTTKEIKIPAHSIKGINGITKVRHGIYSVNAIAEASSTHPLPPGLTQRRSYSNLTVGSSRVHIEVENTTDHEIHIPNRAVVAELHLANIIPKLLFPTIDPEEEKDDDPSFNPSDLDDRDSGLTAERVKAFQATCEDIGEDMEADGIHVQVNDVHTQQPSSSDKSTPQKNVDAEKDEGNEWILKQVDLTGTDEYTSGFQALTKAKMMQYAPLFSKHDLDMGRTDLVKHNIILSDPMPFKEKYRRIPPQMYDEVKTHLKEMLDLGAIRPSHSPWASPIVLVRKKDGRLRFCIDLRKLNQRTIKDSYSLPRIEQVLDSLVGAEIFSTLDLKAGYWQVEMVEECKAYTAFTCGPLGFYECETMPFGATNAPATFQRLMDDCLGELNMNWCIVYLDDIIIFSKDPETHLERLEAVFKKLQAAGLKLKPSKCSFFKKEISYLGHVVSKDGISTDPKR